jgi:hypothetical protein
VASGGLIVHTLKEIGTVIAGFACTFPMLAFFIVYWFVKKPGDD